MNATYSLPDKSNIQGLILKGYTHPCSCHLLFSFLKDTKPANTKSFFNDLYEKVQSAADWVQKPVSMLNIGLTFYGIQQLNNSNQSIIKPMDLDKFPSTFRNGPWSQGSQDSLTDIYDPESIPSKWWNNQGDHVNANLHCVIHVYGLTKSDLDKLVNLVTSSAFKNGLQEILPLAKNNDGGRLYQSIVDDDFRKIHFGYKDGISEPALKSPGKSGIPTTEDFNDFIIGYGNNTIVQPGPFDNTTAGVFAKDGCYNAFRILYQDVSAFNNLLKEQSKKWSKTLSYLGLDDKELEEWFAAKLCGRWQNGSPLMLSPERPSDKTNTAETGEDFGYKELNHTVSKDLDTISSLRCPFSAHTRVANPRNQQLESSEGNSGPPRILRRGMPYGPQLVSDKDDDVDRGLIGLFLCGDFALQFEKLYAWMNYNNFSSDSIFSVLHPPQDALLGNRALKDSTSSPYPGVVTSFKIPIEVEPGEITIESLPQFIKTNGTAYCLLPSLSSLRKIAGIQ
jgi:deferrochelatase/peroxidase EfeB